MDQINYYSTEDQSISLIEGQYQTFAFARHYHLDYHFGLITEGQQCFTHQGQKHCAPSGTLIIMPPDELHDGHPAQESGYQVRVFTVAPDWFSQQLHLHPDHELVGFSQSLIRDPELFQILVQTHQALAQNNICQLAKDCLPYEGFAPLIERYGSLKASSPYRLGKQTLNSLREFLMAHLDQPVHLQQLADLCQLSPSQFQRYFKATTQMTPYAWQTRLRLEQAMKLLKEQQSSTEVALQVGFYDQAHFCKAFKQTYGVTPSQIR
ncbi:AraC family transcriptional regulator [Celerinatantimonas sp. YJH-8]|uniref:helix-turn-helix transcriptional regulator n=1 Tax=Celerinatantimonas sp. YJH-8 TaxID=3228714 RepID=UPI0038C893FA